MDARVLRVDYTFLTIAYFLSESVVYAGRHIVRLPHGCGTGQRECVS